MTQPDTDTDIGTTRLFSVVTVAYNDLAGLRRVAASLLAQDHADWEWIVIDGGSRDRSQDFLAAFGDQRLSYISEPDGGIYPAMNKGIARSGGDYIIFMNSGDGFATPAELRLAASDLVGRPDLLYGDAIETDGMVEHYKRARSHRFAWYSMFTHHQAIYYRRTLFRHVRYDESFRLAADWALTLDMLRLAKKVRRVHRPICRFERGGASFGENRTLADTEAARIYQEHTRLPNLLAWTVFRIKTGVNKVRVRHPELYDMLRMRRRAQ